MSTTMNTGPPSSPIEEQGLKRVVLVVSKQCVKTVKTALERHGKLDQTVKITLESKAGEEGLSKDQSYCRPSGSMRIATLIPYEPDNETNEEHYRALILKILQDLEIPHILDDIALSYHTVLDHKAPTPPKNLLHKALYSGLISLPDSIFTSLDLTRSALLSSFPDGYSIYPPLLLLPHNALTLPPWPTLLASHASTSPALQPFWSMLATAMNVTHIAINSPIPPTQSSVDNILRSPLNITPLHGDFGTPPTEQNKQDPAQKDFDSALWVSCTQNGIHQVWAPLYTMFSRGNIREKTRVLNFASTIPPASSSSSNTKSEQEIGPETAAAAVVDMYVGIGYFALAYRAAHFGPIYCFELNPWSVEGLRRGVGRNGWTQLTYYPHSVTEENIAADVEDCSDNVDFHIYQSSNSHALTLLSRHRTAGPPIRHVNLGLLPQSRDSWRDAVALVDAQMGGCIHAHENVGVGEMDARKEEVEGVFQRYLDEEGKGRKARVEHVERVKMYAPGVVHCVFDVGISGVREVGRG